MLAALGLGGFFLHAAVRWVRSAIQADGEVVEVRCTGKRCNPAVAFLTATGQPRTFVHPIGSWPPRFRRGDHVAVLYQPDDPGDARLRGAFDTWGPPVVALGLGLFGTVFGATRRGRERPKGNAQVRGRQE